MGQLEMQDGFMPYFDRSDAVETRTTALNKAWWRARREPTAKPVAMKPGTRAVPSNVDAHPSTLKAAS